MKATPCAEWEGKAGSCCVKYRYYRARGRDHFTLPAGRKGRKLLGVWCILCSTSRGRIWIPASQVFISRMQEGSARWEKCMESMQEEFISELYLNLNLYWSFLCFNLFMFIYIFIYMYVYIWISCSAGHCCFLFCNPLPVTACLWVHIFVCVHITWTWQHLHIASLVSNIPGWPLIQLLNKVLTFSLVLMTGAFMWRQFKQGTKTCANRNSIKGKGGWKIKECNAALYQ